MVHYQVSIQELIGWNFLFEGLLALAAKLE
jgi:hypothetical protein